MSRAPPSEITVRWLNPLGYGAYDSPIADLLSKIKQPNTKAEVVSFDMAASPTHVEYRAYQALMSGLTVECARDAAKSGVDAMVIGCFYDPDLDNSREISGSTVVVAPAHSCYTAASRLANKFSVLVGRDRWIRQMEECAKAYGVRDRITSFRPLGMGVDNFQKDHGLTRRKIIEEARKAVDEDGAEAVILGCTIEFGFFEEVQREVGVPVIDAVIASFLEAEQAARLKKQFGWKPSRVGSCEAPPEEELERHGLFKTGPSMKRTPVKDF